MLPTDGVDISAAAVILGEVASQALIHIGTSKDQQEPAPAPEYRTVSDHMNQILAKGGPLL